MKISQVLLSAIILGVTVQGLSSCNKKQQDKIKPASEQQAVNQNNPNPDPGEDCCPACGMG